MSQETQEMLKNHIWACVLVLSGVNLFFIVGLCIPAYLTKQQLTYSLPKTLLVPEPHQRRDQEWDRNHVELSIGACAVYQGSYYRRKPTPAPPAAINCKWLQQQGGALFVP